MRLAIFGVIGLVVGMGGGVGFSLMRGGGEPAVHEEGAAVADTLAHAEQDTAGVVEVAVADSTAMPDSTQAPAAADSLTRSIASSLIRVPRPDSSGSDPTGPPGGETPGAPSASPDTAGEISAGERGTEDPEATDLSTGEAIGSEAVGPGATEAAEAGGAPDLTHDSTNTPVPPSTGEVANVAAQLSPDDDAGYRRVSRILAAMDSDEAAQVLAGLQDDEVRQLITLLPPRTAASILAELDPGRVARLSRGLFKPAGSFR